MHDETFGMGVAPSKPNHQPQNHMHTKSAFLIDMDGVLYRENSLLAGAAEMITLFQEKDIPFLFLTNNSMPTPEDLVVKLEHLGIPGLSARHFYTSAQNTADFLTTVHPRATAFVVGEGGMVSVLRDAGIPNDSFRPTYVVVGEGAPTFEKMNKAHELIEQGARFVATNPDNWCPVGPNKTRPGAGALASYLEASTGRRAYFLGKPNPFMYTQACRRLLSHRPTLTNRDIIMIGDTMETDIRGAVEIGLQAYLVLTGSTSLEDVPDYVYQPTRVLAGIHTLVEELRAPEETAPAPVNRGSTSTTPGVWRPQASLRRHPTAEELAHRRPRPAMTK